MLFAKRNSIVYRKNDFTVFIYDRLTHNECACRRPRRAEFTELYGRILSDWPLDPSHGPRTKRGLPAGKRPADDVAVYNPDS